MRYSVESLLLGSANGKDVPEILEQVAAYFRDKVDLGRLKIQLVVLLDAIRTASSGTATTIKKVTNVRTIADLFKEIDIFKGMLNEVEKVVQVYLKFPTTSATAERSFSSL